MVFSGLRVVPRESFPAGKFSLNWVVASTDTLRDVGSCCLHGAQNFPAGKFASTQADRALRSAIPLWSRNAQNLPPNNAKTPADRGSQ